MAHAGECEPGADPINIFLAYNYLCYPSLMSNLIGWSTVFSQSGKI